MGVQGIEAVGFNSTDDFMEMLTETDLPDGWQPEMVFRCDTEWSAWFSRSLDDITIEEITSQLTGPLEEDESLTIEAETDSNEESGIPFALIKYEGHLGPGLRLLFNEIVTFNPSGTSTRP